jgi:hypothetical protein
MFVRRLLLAAALYPLGALLASPASARSPARPQVAAIQCGTPAVVTARPAQAAAPLVMSNDMRASGFVYTLDNDVQRNGIAVFRRQTDGSLVPLPGSPFQAGGKGLSGGDIDEQGAIRVNGKYVLAVNPGSDSIAVMEKSSRGLLHVEGSPFPSGGSTPLSLTVHGDLVYVANQAAAFAGPKSAPNITRGMPQSRTKEAPVSEALANQTCGPLFLSDRSTLAATAIHTS